MNTAAPQSLRPAAVSPHILAGDYIPRLTPTFTPTAPAAASTLPASGATEWAWQQQGLKAAHKLVLLAVARHAMRSTEVWPSLATLAELTGLDRKTVRQVLADLEQLGKLADTGRRAGRTGQVRVLRILCDDAAESGESCSPLCDLESVRKASVLEGKASVFAPQSVQCSIGKTDQELVLEFEIEEGKQAGASAHLEQPCLHLQNQNSREEQPAATAAVPPAQGTAQGAHPAPGATGYIKATSATPAAVNTAPHQHRPARRPSVAAAPLRMGRAVVGAVATAAACCVPTATGLPVLPPPAPMPLGARAELARIRADAHARRLSGASAHPPKQIH